MRAFKAALAVFLFCSIFFVVYSKQNCPHLLHTLASHQQDYVRCSTSNAVPVKLCMGCELEYNYMQEAYRNLTANCSKEYFDHDRINVVQTTQNMLLGLWKKAYCDDCLNRNHSGIFEDKHSALYYCFHTHEKDGDQCAACIELYLELNNFYISLDQKNNGEVCYDLQDAMNQTRVYWSKQLNCCHREFRMTLFLIATISVGSLPIVFYVSAYILTKRRERNHAVLNIEEELDRNRLIADTPIVQPMQNSVGKPRGDNLKQLSDEDTDSDDENMPKMQKLIEADAIST